MKIDSLTLLTEVARYLSFAEVARQREIDPSQVSRQVSAIEAEIGIRIFQRNTRKLSVTDEGAEYLRRIAPALETLEEAADIARDGQAAPTGLVRLTASVAFGDNVIVPLLPELRKVLPDVQLDCIFRDEQLDLVRNGIDLAIRLVPEPEGDLVCRRLFFTEYRVCASPDWVKQHGPVVRPHDLTDHDCLCYAIPGMRSSWTFREGSGPPIAVPVAGSVAMSNPVALRSSALLGLGPALLATWLVSDDIKRGALLDLFPGHSVTATEFKTAAWLLYPSRTYLPTRTRAVIDFLVSALRQGGPSNR